MDTYQSIFEKISLLEDQSIHEDPEEENICFHSHTTTEHGAVLCMECGEEVITSIADIFKQTTDPSRCYIRKVSEKSIYSEIVHMNISQHIQDLANDIYIQVCGTTPKHRRGVNRKGIIFASIFHAYKLNLNAQSCESLLNVFNIKRRDALKGLKYINENAPPNSPLRTTYITPEHLIQEFMKRFNADQKSIQEVLDLYHKIKGKSSIVNRSRPQSVAAGLIYFYSYMKGNDINIKEFTKKVSLSELTINKLAKECARILK